MFRIRLENRTKRIRTENWSEDEKILLENLVKERYNIIENKNTDSTTNVLKAEAWKQIWERFVLENRRPRSVQHLKNQWKSMKGMKARKQYNKNGFHNSNNVTERESKHRTGLVDMSDAEHHTDQPSNDPLEQDTSIELPVRDFKRTTDSFTSSQNPPKTKRIITQMYHSQRGGIEYKRSLLELNKIVKEQLTNCALEEHTLRMQQLKEEHEFKLRTANELHSLECENKRLQAEVLRLDIEIRKKQLDNFVM